MRERVVVLLGALILCASGCASAGAGSGSGKSSDLITQSEIAASNQETAYDVVERLRPVWISRAKNYVVQPYKVSTQAAGQVLVFLDQTKQGDIETLRNISTAQITSIEWMDPPTATARLPGIGFEMIGGAIVAHSRPKR